MGLYSVWPIMMSWAVVEKQRGQLTQTMNYRENGGEPTFGKIDHNPVFEKCHCHGLKQHCRFAATPFPNNNSPNRPLCPIPAHLFDNLPILEGFPPHQHGRSAEKPPALRGFERIHHAQLIDDRPRNSDHLAPQARVDDRFGGEVLQVLDGQSVDVAQHDALAHGFAFARLRSFGSQFRRARLLFHDEIGFHTTARGRWWEWLALFRGGGAEGGRWTEEFRKGGNGGKGGPEKASPAGLERHLNCPLEMQSSVVLR